MLSELTNHLWQSTVFAVAVGLLTLAFRRNRARVRYWLWLSASVKFLVPFSLLIGVGSRMEWRMAAPAMAATPAVAFTLVEMSAPFPAHAVLTPERSDQHWMAIAIFAIWACGFGWVAWQRLKGWRGIRAAVRASSMIGRRPGLEVRSTPGLLEPGVVGFFHQVLLLPEGIEQRLTPGQMEAIVMHELCHARRRDNLTSAVHMVVEALFWFHPLVWWVGARLVQERERACDESVLRLGNEAQEYAAGILAVCKSYLESPLPCVSGVTGADLKKRVQAILSGRVGCELTLGKKVVLALAGVVVLAMPVVVGLMAAPRLQADARRRPQFETATIKPCAVFRQRSAEELVTPGRLLSGCTTLDRFIEQAYGPFADGHTNRLSTVKVLGGAAWTGSDLYEIDAQAGSAQSHAMMNGPMLQGLFEDRFELKVHRETRTVPVYALTVATGGSNARPFRGSCVSWDYDNPPAHPAAPSLRCERGRLTNKGVELDAATMADLCYFFLVTLDRPVVDKTGMKGRFDFHLELPSKDLGYFRGAHGLPAASDPAAQPPDPAFVSAIKTSVRKLGLNLEPSAGPGDFLVIDRVDRPSGN